ncbi:MAG: hypothetical protein JHD02_04195 [Thermoleophilaceae bacterium]|nr:hypothetical protein [Thermoleophilaceae bacterium]
MAHVNCTIEVDVDYDDVSRRVEHVKIRLPRSDEYQQTNGRPLSRRDWLTILDWSWGDFEFESRLNAGVEFEVVGRWSDEGKSEVLTVVSDTPKHALSKANAIHSDEDREFIPALVLFEGEVIATAE